MTHLDAILYLLLSPFIATVVFLIACAMTWTFRIERKNRDS